MKLRKLLLRSLLLTDNSKSIDLTYLFIRTCESLTIMFHLLGRDTASKGMSCEKGSERKRHTEQMTKKVQLWSWNGSKLFGRV